MPALRIENSNFNSTISSSAAPSAGLHFNSYNLPTIFNSANIRNLVTGDDSSTATAGGGGGGSTIEQQHNQYQIGLHQPQNTIGNLILSNNHNYNDETIEELYYGSPLAFDASEYGLWNGRFVPPPPRPPFMDDLIATDGVTTCDLCSWAMPTKSTFIFEGTIEKATELGWPLTLIIVSIISAILGAIVMVTIVRCKRKKSTNSRNETHVQWWSRNKRTTNQLRRSNIYTAHPADSIRGLQTNSTLESCNWPNVTTIVVNS